MSVFQECPHSGEECIHEIYAGEPRYNLCKTCSVFKKYSSNCDKQALETVRVFLTVAGLRVAHNNDKATYVFTKG